MASTDDRPTGSPSPDEPPPWLPGNRYRLLGPLGRGGMGEVFLAEDTVLRRKVAVKHVLAEFEHDRERLRRLLSEAHHLSRLNDPHVAALLDVIETDPTHFVLVMEYVPGVSLRDRMQEPIALEDFWDIAIQCAEAVSVIHRNGYIHRDLKPENIMITPNGLAKVLDLGLSVKSSNEVLTGGSTLSMERPRLAGTPPYMAPETWAGAEPDYSADIFSLGVVLYEMLVGRKPFDGGTTDEIRHRILHTEPIPVRRAGADVPAALEQVVGAALEKDPQRRTASAGMLLEDLVAARHGKYKVRLVDGDGREVKSHRLRVLVGSGLTLALAGAVWVAVSPEPRLRLREALGLVSLPEPRRVAFLPATVREPDENLAAFGLGLTELLSAGFQSPDRDPGLRVVAMALIHAKAVTTARLAEAETGANLALATELSQQGTGLEARLALLDADREHVLDRETVAGTQIEPYVFAEHVADAIGKMLHTPVRPRSPAPRAVSSSVYWFWLEGLGHLAGAPDSSDARLALEHFERAASADSKYAPAWVGRSRAALVLYEKTQDAAWLDLAGSASATAMTLAPEDPEAHFARARWHAARKEWGPAIFDYEWVVDLDPYSDAAYSGLADAYRRAGRLEEADRTDGEAVAAWPGSFQRWWNLAYYRLMRGQVEGAEAAYRGMVEAAPALYAGYQGLGGVLVRQGRHAEATQAMEKAIELKPEKNTYSNLATSYFILRDFDRAIRTYQNAIALGYQDLVIWMNLGDAYYCSPTMRDRADSAYRTALALGLESLRENPDDAWMLARMADAYARVGEADSARAFLARVKPVAGDNAEVYEWIALAQWQLGRHEEAFDALGSALGKGTTTTWLRDSAMFDPWREDPRFQALVSEAGSAPAAPATTGRNQGG